MDKKILTGLDDAPLFDDEEEQQPEQTYEFDYDEFMRERAAQGLTDPPGYGKKTSFQGEIPKDDGDSYYKTTSYTYQKQSDETAEMIARLKERDEHNKLRDDRIISIVKITAAQDLFFALFPIVMWYLASFGAGFGIAWAARLRGMDPILVGCLIGALTSVLRYNAEEAYDMWASMKLSFSQLSLLVMSAVLWVMWLCGERMITVLLCTGFGIFTAGQFLKFLLIDKKPPKEALFRCLPVVLFFLLILGFGMGMSFGM